MVGKLVQFLFPKVNRSSPDRIIRTLYLGVSVGEYLHKGKNLHQKKETDRGYELTTKEVRRKVQLWVRELRSTNHLLPPTELDIEEILKQPPNTIKGYVSPVPPDIILFPSEVCNFWGGVLSVFGFESTFPFWLGKG
eukprot:TRINITY_DN5809_c0_g1_i7.p1 TRINITY_DN5809_c0_g1~~TRINITY_DN5809_c0_g1_i7.p1  ORF type:complete len:137 (+),score=19.14 TRINITY_DN5809_c0_g1_i7:148-558(+)